ncbi:hypothetical protein Tco_1377067 [Tanacetum coccineum]
MNMLNRNYEMNFSKPEFLKKAQRVNPRLYDIGYYNDNLALTLPYFGVYTEMGRMLLILQCDLSRRFGKRSRQPIAVPISTREPKQTVNQSVATSYKKIVSIDSTVKKPRNIIRKIYEQVSKTCSWWYPKFTPPGYKWKPKSPTGNVNPNLIEIILFIVDSGCLKQMMGNLKLLTNFVEKSLGMVKFGNDQIAPILGYEDLVQGTITIKRVYYVEGLNHNLFSVGQFCDADFVTSVI